MSALAIAIIGTGKIGSTFAYKLAEAGHKVTVVARPGSKRFTQLTRDGGIVLTTGERAPAIVVDQLDEETAYDLVVVTTKDHQVEPLLPSLRRSRAQAIQFMFVTFNPERLNAAVGEERCSLGMPAVMARLDDAGRLTPTINARQKTLHGDRRWMELFAAAGIPSAFEPKMADWLRCHVPMTVAMESVSVAAVRRRGAAPWGEAVIIARGMRAGYAIIKKLGSPLYPRSKRLMNTLPLPLTAFFLRFLSGIASFRELLAEGSQEARALIDSMIEEVTRSKMHVGMDIKAVEAMKPKAAGDI